MFGTACVLRVKTVGDLARAVEANFDVDSSCFFNLSRVEVSILEVAENGVVKPPLNHFTELDEFMAILRGNLSEMWDGFKNNAGKQGSAVCVVAAGMTRLLGPVDWSEDTLDKILVEGDKLYEQSMEKMYVDIIQPKAVAAAPPPPAQPEKKTRKRGGGFPVAGGWR